MKPIIRKARSHEREAIHQTHMRSIREICLKDHGEDEIKGWGYRELGERWIESINGGLVWVVEHRGSIHGLASIGFTEDGKSAEIQALYLTPEVIGLGIGRQLMSAMLDEAKERGSTYISLDSTITAHDFYKKFGFKDCGPVQKRPIGGSPVTSFPMQLDLDSA